MGRNGSRGLGLLRNAVPVSASEDALHPAGGGCEAGTSGVIDHHRGFMIRLIRFHTRIHSFFRSDVNA